MFIGFFSRRTLKGFYRSYFRYCVRSYIRNIWDYQDKVKAEELRIARGGEPRDPVTGRIPRNSIPREDETPKELTLRVSCSIGRQAARRGIENMEEIRAWASAEVESELRKLALSRGLPVNTYIDGYEDPRVRNDRDGTLGGGGGRGGGYRGRSSSPPAVKPNGGLHGGAFRRKRG